MKSGLQISYPIPSCTASGMVTKPKVQNPEVGRCHIPYGSLFLLGPVLALKHIGVTREWGWSQSIFFFISSHQCLDDDWDLPELQFFQWLAHNIVLGLSNIGCVK